MARDPAQERRDQEGFTLLELMMTVAVMAVVLVVAGTSLISLSMSANRGSSLVSEEQLASTTLGQMGYDIRSAHTLVIPSGTTVGNQLELEVNTASGPCTSNTNPGYPSITYELVEWVYVPSSSSLTRELLDCSTGAVTAKSWTLPDVVNASSSTPVFKYYNQFGSDISGTLDGAIANCTTRVAVDLLVGSKTPGVTAVEEKQNVTLTDQLEILSQPGNGQC